MPCNYLSMEYLIKKKVMNLKRFYYKFCCVMQWNIGFAKYNIADIIREKRNDLKFKWFPIEENGKSYADPFIFRADDRKLHVIYEEFSMVDLKKYGKLALSILREDLTICCSKEILDSKTHSSYPFILSEDNKTYVIPESSQRGKVSCYQFDFVNKCLINERIIINNIPLLDSTILKYNNKFWLFATLADHKFDHSKLYIYYADSLFGEYKPHIKNPVKHGLNGTRPAGNIITVDNEMYRPAQNCKKYYGESITINKIITLNENEFVEEDYLQITADKKSSYSEGIHTINFLDDIIVVDGIKMIFMPLKKLKMFFQKKINSKM